MNCPEILTLSATIRSHKEVMDLSVRGRNYFGAGSIDQIAPGLIYMLARYIPVAS
jgi:hypothetical protein